MTKLMALHHGLLMMGFLDVSRVTLIPDALPTLNLPIKSHPSSG